MKNIENEKLLSTIDSLKGQPTKKDLENQEMVTSEINKSLSEGDNSNPMQLNLDDNYEALIIGYIHKKFGKVPTKFSLTKDVIKGCNHCNACMKSN